MTRVRFLVFTLLLFATPLQAEVPPIDAQLEQKFEEVMKQYSIPGLAVGVIKDGQLIYAKGFGFRNKELSLPVTPQTLFAIGSTTKAFTATGVGLLVQEGKLKWDQPIVEYFPDFHLKDPTAALNASMVDILSHRTGLPRHDAAWYGRDRLETSFWFEKLKYMEPSKGFRETWQYNNFMYMAAGHISAEMAGQSWPGFIRNRILNPLGMNSTVFTVDEMKSAPDAAVAYSRSLKEVGVPVPYRAIIGMAPAGALNSNLEDMSKWLAMNMNGGEFEGRRIVEAETLDFVQSPHMLISGKPPVDGFSAMTYGLGWINMQYYGQEWIWHNGGIDGMLTHVGFLPDKKIGIVVFQNADYADMGLWVAMQVWNRVLGVGEVSLTTTKLIQAPELKKIEPPVALPLIRPAQDYVGLFENSLYGDIEIYIENEVLMARFHGFHLKLTHVGNGTFKAFSEEDTVLSVILAEETPALVSDVDATGAVVRLRWELETGVKPAEFNRVSSKAELR